MVTTIMTPDKHHEQGVKFEGLYLETMKEIESAVAEGKGIAELREKADSLYDLSQSSFQKWESLKQLNAERDEDIKGLQNESNNRDQSSADEQAAIEQAAKFGGYKSIGDWAIAVYHLKKNQMTDGKLKYWDGDSDDARARVIEINNAKALAEHTGATGGLLVPAEFQARVKMVQDTATIVRPRAEIIRMNRRQVTLPVLNQQGTVSGGASWYGGIVTYYADEAGSLTESTPSWRDVTLTAHKLTGLTRTSNELLADSAIALEDFLMGDMGFPGAMAHRADMDYLSGSGVGKPEGILNSNALLATGGHANGNRLANNDVQYEDLTAMLGKMLPTANGVWIANQSVLTTLMNMNGPTGNASYLWGNTQAGVPNTLLGRPIIFTDKLPALGTLGDIMLVDFSYYMIGDRQAMTMDMSTQEGNSFVQDQSTWRMTMRHDGKAWMNAPITYQDGTTQVSPFVALSPFSG